MKIFVSHAAVDREIASALVDFLELGMGVHPDQTFFSSQPGSIEIGHNFVDDILRHLDEAHLLICLLSEGYLKSQFCMAELGAARMAAFPDSSGGRRFFSCLIPPLEFKEVGGMLTGVQSGKIMDRTAHANLREVVRQTVDCTYVPENKWITRQDKFIDTAQQHIRNGQSSYNLAQSISLEEVVSEFQQDLVHKRKIIFTFKNNSADELTAGPSQWHGMIRLFKNFSPLQMKVIENGKWSEDKPSVRVPAKTQFRAWISLDTSVDDKYLFSLTAMNQVGEIRIALEKDGTQTERAFKI